MRLRVRRLRAGTGKLHKPILFKEELQLNKSHMADGAPDFRGSTYHLVLYLLCRMLTATSRIHVRMRVGQLGMWGGG